MKKILVTILAFLYLGSVTGATLHIHYCMGEMAGWGLWKENTSTCSRCGMDKNETDNNGCCKDEQKQVKADDDQKTPEPVYKGFIKFQHPQYSFFITYREFFTHLTTKQLPENHAPPRCIPGMLHVFNCTFLI